MKKKLPVIILILTALIGSFINFYASNLFLSDVSNLTFGFYNRPYYVLATLPGVSLAFIFVLLAIFLVRYIRHPEYLKRMSKLYVIIFMAFSFVGLVSSILSGILVYKTFTAPNPFPGYLILSIILFSICLILGVLFFTLLFKRIPEDKERKEITAGYVFFSILFSVLTYFAFNRFGAVLWICSYVDGPTLYMTWPFYLYLLLPICMFVHTVLYAFDFYKKHNLAALVTISVITGLFIIGGVYTILVGRAVPEFISVISPAEGASRLLAKPIGIILHIVLFGILDIYSLYHSIKYYKKHKVKVEN